MPNRSPVKNNTLQDDSDRSTPIDYDTIQGSDSCASNTQRGIPRNASWGSDEGNFRRPRRERSTYCRSFMSTGYCQFGARCNFSHAVGSAPPPPSYEMFIDSCPSTPLTQAASFPYGSTHYRHEPYSLDAFVFFGDEEFAY